MCACIFCKPALFSKISIDQNLDKFSEVDLLEITKKHVTGEVEDIICLILGRLSVEVLLEAQELWRKVLRCLNKYEKINWGHVI